MNPSDPTQTRSGVQRRLWVLAGSTLFALAVLEIAFRCLGVRGYHEPRTRDWSHALLPPTEKLPCVVLQFKPHARFELRYESNPDGYFDATNGIVYETNDHGFRGPEFDDLKAAGTRRIAVLGDSFTFGEGVKEPDTFCAQMRDLFGPGVEVLNLGASAWGTKDEICYLEARGIQFQPDLVVVAYVLNDADYAGGLDLWVEFRSQYEKRWLKHSYLASWVYAMIARGTLGRQYLEQVVASSMNATKAWDESFAMLSRGQEIAAQHGAKFMVCIFPFMYDLTESHPMKPVHARIRAYCESHGIATLDLLDAFMGQKDTTLWAHPTDQHPNARGHRIAARALTAYIREHALLDAAPPTDPAPQAPR